MENGGDNADGEEEQSSEEQVEEHREVTLLSSVQSLCFGVGKQINEGNRGESVAEKSNSV